MFFKLRKADFSIPFVYDGGDAVMYSGFIKAILRNGWYLYNPVMGAPFGAEIYDFPLPDNLHFGIIKFIGFFTPNFAVPLNLFYLLTFPLTTLVALYVLRKFNVSAGPAILASLLFNFTDYHARRSEHHLMYSAYYIVPIMVMLLIWICSREIEINRWKDLRSPKIIWALFLGVLVGMAGGAYYTYFALLLLASVALFVVIRRRNLRGALMPAALFIVIAGTLIANVAPNLVYKYNHRDEIVDTGQRNPGESEIFGLKIVQLLLPIDDHRLKPLSRIRAQYNATAPMVNENSAASLGLFGAIGFLFLLGRLLYLKSSSEEDSTGSLLDYLSVINVSSVLLGTIGGFGTLIAALITPQIRAYNRLSVYIGFCSVFAGALLLDRMRERYFTSGRKPLGFALLIVVLIGLGIMDQTSKRPLPNFAETKTKFLIDREFIAKIEEAVPNNAAIFQLPYQMFPEGPTYRHLVGYLQSDRLRWSFEATRGRRGDLWAKAVSDMSPDRMVETLYQAGLSGVYIDRIVMPEWVRFETAFTQLLRTSPIVSDDGQMSFFSFANYQPLDTTGDPEARKRKALNPIFVSWQPEFSGMEGTTDNNWHWCSQRGRIILDNTSDRPREVTLSMNISAIMESNLTVSGSILNERFRISDPGTDFVRTVSLPPGRQIVDFYCDGRIFHPDGDARALVFRVNNFKLTEN